MRISAFILATLCVTSSPIFANTEPAPFDINVAYDTINKADMHRRHKGDKLSFRYDEKRVLGLYTYGFTKDTKVRVGFGVKNYMMKFEKVHPGIHQTEFYNYLVNLAGETATKLYKNIKLRGDMYFHTNVRKVNMRNTFILYELEGILWANDRSRLHLGVVGTTGLHFTRTLPIIGFDYKRNEFWKFNLVFPTNISAVYSFNKQLSMDAGVRWFISRQRLRKTEHSHLKEGLITYLNGGFEVGLKCEQLQGQLVIAAHAGHTFKGRARVGDSLDHHRQSYRVKSAPYFGASIDYGF